MDISERELAHLEGQIIRLERELEEAQRRANIAEAALSIEQRTPNAFEFTVQVTKQKIALGAALADIRALQKIAQDILSRCSDAESRIKQAMEIENEEPPKYSKPFFPGRAASPDE